MSGGNFVSLNREFKNSAMQAKVQGVSIVGSSANRACEGVKKIFSWKQFETAVWTGRC